MKRLHGLTQQRRMVLNYLLVFTLPLVTICAFYFLMVLPRYEKNIMDYCTHTVEAVFQSVDKTVTVTNGLLTEMQNDDTLSPVKDSAGDPMKALEIQKRLASYVVSNGIYDEIVMLYAESGAIISSKTSYTPESIDQLFPRYEGMEADGLYGQLLDIRQPSWRRGTREYAGRTFYLVSCIAPMSYSLGREPACAVLTVEADSFLRSVFGQFPYPGSVLTLHDMQGRVFLSSRPDPAVDDGRFLIFERPLAGYGLSVRIAVPRRAVFSELNLMKIWFLILIGVLLVSCSAIVTSFLLRYHKTMASLRLALAGTRFPTYAGDDIVAATQTIDRLQDVTQNLQANLDNSRLLIEELQRYKLEMQQSIPNVETTADTVWIQQVLDYFEVHYSEYDLSVKSVAQSFGMSDNAFSQRFKRMMDKSPNQLIAELRINRAKELLVSTALPIHEIVEQIGYADASAFIRKFKSIVGVTPGRFRQDFRNSSDPLQ